MARLKFTVVSEPMDDDEECVDVGHAFLDLQELLLTGNNVSDQQINGRCCICVITLIPRLLKQVFLQSVCPCVSVSSSRECG